MRASKVFYQVKMMQLTPPMGAFHAGGLCPPFRQITFPFLNISIAGNDSQRLYHFNRDQYGFPSDGTSCGYRVDFRSASEQGKSHKDLQESLRGTGEEYCPFTRTYAIAAREKPGGQGGIS